jgi:hypothetical protein
LFNQQSFCIWESAGYNNLVVGVSSSDRCYCLSLRCYQVPGGVVAVPHFCCFVVGEISVMNATLDFYFSVRRFAFLIPIFILYRYNEIKISVLTNVFTVFNKLNSFYSEKKRAY